MRIPIRTTVIYSRQNMCCIHSLKSVLKLNCHVNDLFFNHPLHKLVVISLIIIAHMGQVQICRKNTQYGEIHVARILGTKWSSGVLTDMTNCQLKCISAVILILSHSLRDETSTSIK